MANVKTKEVKKAERRAKFLAGIDKFMGPEPLPAEIKTRLDINKAYNWYNYSCNNKQLIPWIVEFMINSNRYTKKQISAFKTVPQSRIIPTAGAIARIVNNGADIPTESIDWAHDKILYMLNYAPTEAQEKPKPVMVISIADRVREKNNEIIGSLEEQLDIFFMNDYSTNLKPYDFMKKLDVKALQANKIAAFYKPLRDELKEAMAGKDAQLKEGYKRLNKAQLRRYLEFVDAIISGAESIAQMKKAVRKTRKPVEKSATQLTSKIKYLKESAQFKIASINPTRIIRAQTLIVFNTKYKKLGIYVAKDATGLSVKGTTITNFDPEASVAKTLRKPEDILPSVLNNSKAAMNKMFGGIKSTPTTLNGRVNEDTVLIRTF